MLSQQLHWNTRRQNGPFTVIEGYFREEEDPNLANIQKFSRFIAEQKGNISQSLLQNVQNNIVELEQNFQQAPLKKLKNMLATLQKNEEEGTNHSAFYVLNFDSEIPRDWLSPIQEVGFLDTHEMKRLFRESTSFFMSKVYVKDGKGFFFFKEEEARKMIPHVFSLSTVVDTLRKENPYILLDKAPSYTAKNRLAVPIYFDGTDGELSIHYEHKTFFVKFESFLEKIEEGEENPVLQATKRILQKVEKSNRLSYLYKKKPNHFAEKLFGNYRSFLIEPISHFLGGDELEKKCAEMLWKGKEFESYEMATDILIFHEFDVYVKAYDKLDTILIGRTIEELMQKEQEFMVTMFQKAKEEKEKLAPGPTNRNEPANDGSFNVDSLFAEMDNFF